MLKKTFKRLINISKLIFAYSALYVSCTTGGSPERVTGLITRQAMVVSAHPIASQAGVEILQKGGNAVDAAIAVQFALAVVYPQAGNIGGGGFMLVRTAEGETSSLDFRETAPLEASRDMFLDSLGEIVEGASTRGHLASGVPGTVAGMVAAHERYGSLAWQDLLQPAIKIALEGHVLTEKAARSLNYTQEDLKLYNTLLPNHLIREWEKGDTIYHTDLGKTLQRISDNKERGFYMGKTADDLVAEMERGGGIISHEDLQSYRAKWRAPISGTYKEYKVISMGPPSSGGVALLQLLNSSAPYSISPWGHNSTETVHFMTEAERRVYADRATYLGDMDFVFVPVDSLINKDYMQERMTSFNPNAATPSTEIKAGNIPMESEETTHFSIIDEKGNAVSLTTTINGGFGSKVVVSGSGFILNNEMDDFSSRPGHPNMFGLVGGEANAISPSKRMLSSMTPTIVEKNNSLYMVVGTPGGATIITSVFQTVLNVIEHGMTMQEAVGAPRFHSQWLPDVIFYERGAISSGDSVRLSKMGHILELRGPIGRVDAILVGEDGSLEGGADPRGDDTAMGY